MSGEVKAIAASYLAGVADCIYCMDAGEVDAHGATYDALANLIGGLGDSYTLPCPNCRPADALEEIIQLADERMAVRFCEACGEDGEGRWNGATLCASCAAGRFEVSE